MKESDQVKLSRYIDSDLSPLERKGVEAALETDPTARRMASEYALIRQYVKELPREPLGVDLVPAVHEALTRKRWPVSFPTKSPAIAGIMAASVLIACFSVAGYVALNGDSAAPNLPPGARATVQGSSAELSSLRTSPSDLNPASPPAPVTEIEKQVEENAEKPQPQIAMAPQPIAVVARESSAASAAPAHVAGLAVVATKPEPSESDQGNPRKAKSPIDRRHALRLHVASASDRQIASILSLIGQYRAADTPVMEREIAKSGENPTSLAFVALIPTGKVQEFQESLRQLPEIELELDKPEEGIFRKAELSDGFRSIGNDVIERAIAATGQIRPESDSPQPGPSKRTEIVESVPDAISQPLKVDAEVTESRGTLDQVLVLIRTDPLRVDSKEAKTSRKIPAQK